MNFEKILGVALVGEYKATHATNTNTKRQVDANLSGLSVGGHTLRTRRRFADQRSLGREPQK